MDDDDLREVDFTVPGVQPDETKLVHSDSRRVAAAGVEDLEHREVREAEVRYVIDGLNICEECESESTEYLECEEGSIPRTGTHTLAQHVPQA